MTTLEYLLAAAAAAAAGGVNALAGGGTLISFPVLLGLGVPPIAANVTNAVALAPGYFGGAWAQRVNLRGQRGRLMYCLPVAVAGGFAGAMVLLHTRERVFETLVPWMLLFASVLLALQNRVRAAVVRRLGRAGHEERGAWLAALGIGAASIYGGFFTAGMSVIVMAALGTTLDDTFTRLNALKQLVAVSVSTAAVVIFVVSGPVIWVLAAVMAVGAVAGGVLGGKLAHRMNPEVLRWVVVSVGIALAAWYGFVAQGE